MEDFRDLIKRPLSYEYVDTIIDKLARTLDKYQLIIPEMDDMVREITTTRPKDNFDALMTILTKITEYQSVSPFMDELAEGVKQDFWHGVNEEFPRHEGEFYIISAAD
jgi:hypothetical protein